jgi:ectoine hydroxylase-related dioxygenase (phytanoyl-CoA dioxygenase family)
MNISDIFWRQGYAILSAAIEQSLIVDFWSEFEILREKDPLLMFSEYGQVRRGRDLSTEQRLRQRATNLLNRSPKARQLATHPAILSAFTEIYGEEPACIQTLAYSQSSRQGAHSDLHLVKPPWTGRFERSTLCACWIACEEASRRNGALVIYPGSHRIDKPTLEQCGNDYASYMSTLDRLCRDHGCEPTVFSARAGDILLWHGDFVHAGGEPVDHSLTRASLVCHYAKVSSQDVVPGRATFMTNDKKYVFADSNS